MPIGILTADCSPILIFDYKKNNSRGPCGVERGAYKQIVIKVLKKFIKLGSKKKNIIVSIGPTISQNNYEVGKEFKYKFLKKNIRIQFSLNKNIKKFTLI